MEYTVQKLAELAGVSPRTLRYYDEIGILKPARINTSGYRIYGQNEVEKLQQILFYRELGVELDNIKKIITSPSFNGATALKNHREKLIKRREQLDILIANVEKSIEVSEGRMKMSNKEKFEGFKKNIINENENKYGREIYEKYGKEKVNEMNAKFLNMTEEEYKNVTAISEQLEETLAEAFRTGDPASEIAQKAAELHKIWLSYYWTNYSRKAHAGLAQMYVDDERFTAYYDKKQPGIAKFLRDAIHIYTGEK